MGAKILVVEDESAIAELLQINLEMDGHSVICVESAEDAHSYIREQLPDMVLLDWMLPKQSGIEFARKLRGESRTKNLPIIMLTAKGEEEDKLRGLETGADDYITKPFSVRELKARIKAVLRRWAPEATDDFVKYDELQLNPATHDVSANGKEAKMGPTEFRLLHFLITHPERVYSRAQLLDQVWGDHVFLEERTVDVHIGRLRNALEPIGCEPLVQTVRGAGYRLAKKGVE
jgi:two-component system, OmpR family, phosphate regulon response regulator PhoB